jgi:membrane fusion protein (multidrug efflux system)
MAFRRLSRGLIRFVLLICLPAVAIATAGYFYLMGGRYVSTENAYVKSDIVQISTDLDGRVIDVLVRDHDRVEAGDILFRVDPEPFKIAVAHAEAELAKVGAAIASLQAELQEAVTEEGEWQSRIAYYTKDVERQRSLLTRGVTTRSRADESELQLSVAKDRLRTVRAKVERVKAALSGVPERPLEQRALYLSRMAELEAKKLDLKRTVVIAPTSGIISNMHLQVGEHLDAGDAAFSLIVDQTPWVIANLKETELTNIEVGQTAVISPDAYPDVLIDAEVESISPATGAEFAILPPQNATGNWVKVVQRLPVKLRLKPGPGLSSLRAGMSVKAEIDTKKERQALIRIRDSWSALAGETNQNNERGINLTPRSR